MPTVPWGSWQRGARESWAHGGPVQVDTQFSDRFFSDLHVVSPYGSCPITQIKARRCSQYPVLYADLACKAAKKIPPFWDSIQPAHAVRGPCCVMEAF